MSLSRYKNLSEILSSTAPTRGKYFTDNQSKLLGPTTLYSKINVEKFLPLGSEQSKQKVEFHVYSRDGGYIASNPYTTNYQIIDETKILFDVQQDLAELGIQSGLYRFVYNILLDRVGSATTEKLFIYDISTSRTELILKLTNPDDVESLRNLKDFFVYWANETKYFINSYLNFGSNNLFPIANIATNNSQNTIYIKLFDPLPSDIQIQNVCWICESLVDSYIDSVELIPRINQEERLEINSPNFDIENLNAFRAQSEYKTWTDLLSTNSDINELVTSNLFRKKYGIKLNIDFTDLNNFIFYSSVEERILNFIYKLELLAWYQDQIDTLVKLNGTYASDILTYSNAKISILNSFDEFEIFLYYGKDYKVYENSSYPIPPIPKSLVCTDNVPITWIEWANTWINAVVIWADGPTVPGNCYLTLDLESPEFQAWKETALSVALQFDIDNEAQLIKTIPEFIKDDTNNNQYLLFVNMIANYFDTIWLYIKQFNSKYDPREHPTLGASGDIISTFAKNLGWNLSETQRAKDLWFYFFGISETDAFTQSDIFSDQLQTTSQEYTKSIWKRIFLNLPFITKSKGTRRSISALLSTYGIPTYRFFIKEYGGPSNAETRPKYKEEKNIPYLKIQTGDIISVPYIQYMDSLNQQTLPSGIYFRFIPNEQYPVGQHTIFSKNNDFWIEINRKSLNTTVADITLYVSSSIGIESASIVDCDIIDKIPTSVFLQTNKKINYGDSGSLDLYVSQVKYEKVKIFDSASVPIQGAFVSGVLQHGSVNLYALPVINSIHELRYWNQSLDVDVMKSHVVSPLSYHGNTIYDANEKLLARYPFWLYNAYLTSSSEYYLLPTNVLYTNNESYYSASFNFSINQTGSFIYNNEFVRYEIPTINGVGILPEKERIYEENNSSILSPNSTTERFNSNQISLDKNIVKIGFSPQFNINEDIFNRYGTFQLDEFIGSTLDNNEKYYSYLQDLSEYYGKTVSETNTIHSYLKSIHLFDFSVFDQIRQTLASKVNHVMGIIIENTELQRIKLKTLPTVIGDDIPEDEKIELMRIANRTLSINRINGNIKNITTIEALVDESPIGNILTDVKISNKHIKLNADLRLQNTISGIVNNNDALTSNVEMVPDYLNNISADLTQRITTFNTRIPYSTVTQSYTSPIIGGDYGYQTQNIINDKESYINSITTQNLYGYYANINYIYPNLDSASILVSSDYNIDFNTNEFFIKKFSKGTENNRYAGCKIKFSVYNSINTTSPAQTNVFGIANIPSGSTSVDFISSPIDSNIASGDSNIQQPSY
jgi:hypothetical protein